MITILSLVLHVLVSPFKTRVQLETEIILLRHQLNVLRRRVPSKPKLSAADRLHLRLALSPVPRRDKNFNGREPASQAWSISRCRRCSRTIFQTAHDVVAGVSAG